MLLETGVREMCETVVPSGSIDLRRNAFRVVESVRLHSLLQKKAGPVYASEVPLKYVFEFDDITLVLNGRADGILQTEKGYIVDEIKCVNVPVKTLTEDICRTHLAQVMCYAFMYAKEKGLDEISVRLTYCDISTEETVKLDYDYSTDDLEAYVTALACEYVSLIKEKEERMEAFRKSAKRLPFPYEDYREGQRIFAEHAIEAICTRKNLFAEAPTGTGKTMSALFPAVKALGNGYGKKIFYFTSKTTIADAAREAFELMQEKGLDGSCIVITAKERMCQNSPDNCDPTLCACAAGHYDRINEAVADAVTNERVFDREVIDRYAKKHCVCRYELSLCISEWCELVICDYNYLFDPIVYFRRYFSTPGDYIFLVDEAHNLGDRARNMYSHSIKSSDLEQLLMSLSQNEKTLYPKLYEVFEYMKSANKFIEINKRSTGDMGVFRSEKPFGILNRKLCELTEAFDNYFRHKPDAPKQLNDIYFDIKKYLKISEYYNEKYLSLIEYRNGEYTFRQMCVDPSEVIRLRVSFGRAAIFFSATLSPEEYYKTLLGGEERDLSLTLDSPFPRENLCIGTTYKFSTRLTDRVATVKGLVKLLHTMISGKSGNYIAFFPSYKYMSTVYSEFVNTYPDVRTIVQHSDMSEDERDEYIKQFEPGAKSGNVANESTPAKDDIHSLFASMGLKRGASFFGNTDEPQKPSEKAEETDSMLAFGVLGGVFAEGIDFAGDKLIGCAIVGVGLPGINDDSNIICEYYNNISDDDYPRGYDYAYRIPGMIKVLQAAGRVIRSESDRGVVLLIDDRYASREYSCLYPAHWKQMKLIGDNDSLRELLRRFWKEK